MASIKNIDTLQPLARPGVSGVYFARCAGRIKIGFSKNIKKRLADLDVACPHNIDLVAYMPTTDAQAEERKYHIEFASLNVKGEWFLPGQNLISKIGRLRDWYAPDEHAEANTESLDSARSFRDAMGNEPRYSDEEWAQAVPLTIEPSWMVIPRWSDGPWELVETGKPGVDLTHDKLFQRVSDLVYDPPKHSSAACYVHQADCLLLVAILRQWSKCEWSRETLPKSNRRGIDAALTAALVRLRTAHGRNLEGWGPGTRAYADVSDLLDGDARELPTISPDYLMARLLAETRGYAERISFRPATASWVTSAA